MSCNDQYKDLLKTGNLKVTRHRNAILEAMEKNDLPMTAESLYMKLREEKISISLSTVYRVLETLVDKGLATRSNLSDDNKALYELKHEDHHHHLLCVKCRQILPVDGCPLKDYEKLLEDRFGFTVKGHNLEVFGYCQKCKEKDQDG